MDYMGLEVSWQGVHALLEKLRTILERPRPKEHMAFAYFLDWPLPNGNNGIF